MKPHAHINRITIGRDPGLTYQVLTLAAARRSREMASARRRAAFLRVSGIHALCIFARKTWTSWKTRGTNPPAGAATRVREPLKRL